MSTFRLILLVSISTQYVMCAATVNVSVQQEQNVSLSCYLNSSSEMAWYRLSSEKITLLVSAARGNLQKKDFITYYNEDESHFRLEEDRRLDSITLAITGVRESDLGLYYCAVRIGAKAMRFGTAVRLTFADAEQQRSSAGVGCRTLLVCACVACGFCGSLCVCALCYGRGSSRVSCIRCAKEISNVKTAQVQYSSLRFLRRSRAAAPAPANVTYATIAKAIRTS
ncbi:V-set and immunoglobulin domain-containing protein 8 [Labeo rohita]|uniref:V-set and immunoglobulin domain-containing protein 8 n=1 Tax=Labeo rohita TaxID=84645 RepID=UPI0021E23720|nr:V-set and immunoglobulin domain-containing protein 8 [Labeo rohita]